MRASPVTNAYALMGGVEKYIRTGAVPSIRSVKWHSGDEAFTDGEAIHLPFPDTGWNDEDVLLWRYKFEHELGHEDPVNAAPHWKTVLMSHEAEIKKSPTLKDICNLLSDHVQERNRIGQYAGRDETLFKGRRVFTDRHLFPAKMPKLSAYQEALTALFQWDAEERCAWNPEMKKYTVNTKITDLSNKMKSGSGVVFSALKNEADVWEAAKKLRPYFPKDEEQAEQSQMMVSPGGSHELKPAEGESTRPWARPERKGGITYVPRLGVGADHPINKAKGYFTGRGGGSKAAASTLIRGTNLPGKVRNWLIAQKRAKWMTGYRSGRLDTSRLTDVLREKDDVFRRREDTRTINTAVVLLADASGSMSGSKWEQAVASACMLGDALAGVGVSLEVAAFTDFHDDKAFVYHTIKSFDKRWHRDTALTEFSKLDSCLCDNPDGEAILWAYNRLKQRSEPRKVLITLSDGQPASGVNRGDMGIEQFTYNVLKKIEKEKQVHVIGLGMGGHSPESTGYSNAIAVKRGDRLEAVLLEAVKNALKN